MSDELKKFVKEHRQHFDTQEPGKGLWEKIDAQLEVKTASKISSRWLSGFKYLGFSASVLVVAIYFMTSHQDNPSANSLPTSVKDTVTGSSEPGAYQNSSGSGAGEPLTRAGANAPAFRKAPVELTGQAANYFLNSGKDTVLKAGTFETAAAASGKNEANSTFGTSSVESGESNNNSAIAMNKTDRAGNTKKNEIYIPADPQELNSYTATLYEGASFCALLRAYKFPGKIILSDWDFRKGSKRKKVRGVLSTTSCGQLADIPNIKAIWFKGRTDKEFTLPIDKRLRNMVLVKRDGRKLRPEAISHYYAGLGAITGYTGKFLRLAFKDKVGMILFFKDAEAGDRIIVDGSMEGLVEDQP